MFRRTDQISIHNLMKLRSPATTRVTDTTPESEGTQQPQFDVAPHSIRYPKRNRKSPDRLTYGT